MSVVIRPSEVKAVPTVAGNYTSICLSCNRQMEFADKRCRLCTDCQKPEPVARTSNPIGAQRYVLSVGHSDEAGLGAEGWVVRMSDHFSSADTAQKWVKEEAYEACARVTKLEHAPETFEQLHCAWTRRHDGSSIFRMGCTGNEIQHDYAWKFCPSCGKAIARSANAQKAGE